MTHAGCEWPAINRHHLKEGNFVAQERSPRKLGSELLSDVLSAAYERTSVIVTTNLPFEQWTEVLGSQRLTGAVLDRLTHNCHILEATGESYRLKDARKRSSKRKNSRSDAKPGN